MLQVLSIGATEVHLTHALVYAREAAQAQNVATCYDMLMKARMQIESAQNSRRTCLSPQPLSLYYDSVEKSFEELAKDVFKKRNVVDWNFILVQKQTLEKQLVEFGDDLNNWKESKLRKTVPEPNPTLGEHYKRYNTSIHKLQRDWQSTGATAGHAHDEMEEVLNVKEKLPSNWRLQFY